MEAFSADLEEAARHQSDLWRSLAGARIFMTGATGFFGLWQLALLEHARRHHGLDVEVTILSRTAKTIPGVRVLAGDARSFAFPSERFTHVLHGATASSTSLSESNPLEMFDVVVEGTRRVLDFAGACGAKRVLLLSSGTVYGAQPPELTHLPESYAGGLDPTNAGNAYHEGKRAAEMLGTLLAKKHGFALAIARGFAFCAPGLPLDIHFAIGNFIRDGLAKQPIRIKGDGTPFRSYMYGSDLAIWLFTMLAKGEGAFNLGSDDGRSLSAIAHEVGRQTGVPVEIAKTPEPSKPASRYVPSIERARRELGLDITVPLEGAIRRTIAYHAE